MSFISGGAANRCRGGSLMRSSRGRGRCGVSTGSGRGRSRKADRVAEHNAGSAKVLARAGFIEVGTETAFAPGVGAEIVERIYRLDL